MAIYALSIPIISRMASIPSKISSGLLYILALSAEAYISHSAPSTIKYFNGLSVSYLIYVGKPEPDIPVMAHFFKR